jgi:integration host factor subunit alpha
MGKTVNREILSGAVHRAVRLTGHESKMLVSQVIEGIAATLERGETVKLSSFGSFVVRQKRERLGRNPKTGEPACISARRILTFKPSPILKKQINS